MTSTVASPPTLSVVVPVYRNEDTVEMLCDQVHAALAGAGIAFELLAVCDGSPDRSWERLCALAHDRPWLIGVRLARNVGEHRAVWTGMQLARGRRMAVLAADLQDPPSALPMMLAELDPAGVDAVLARHTGRYQSRLRTLGSRPFKALRAWLAGVPPGASLHLVLRREVVARLSAFVAPTPFLVSMLGVSGARCRVVDVRRVMRPSGRSAYGEWQRLRLAVHELVWIILWRAIPPLRRLGTPLPPVIAARTGSCDA